MKHPWILVVVLGMVMAARAEEELFTNVYVVAPTFLSVEPGSPRATAKVLLESAGISFPEGASAIYNAVHDTDLFPEATPVFVLEVPENTREATLTLRLSNAPAHEALRYIVSLASCRYEVDGREVRILRKQE